MQSFSLTHVSDAVLLRDLAALIACDRMTTAKILAHIAEVDARRLYAPAGYSSMHAYCVGELRLSEDAAFRRIRAARAARQFPVLLVSLAEGKLNLAAVSLLAPHLTEENLEELLRVACCRRKAEIEEYLARRFGPAETLIRHPQSEPQLVLGRVEAANPEPETKGDGSDPSLENPQTPAQAERPCNEAATAILVRARLSRAKLRYAQSLLSHAIPSGDVNQVLDRALDALIHQMEKRKIGATSRTHRIRPTQSKRHIPAHVRRTVWDRDGGQCTFVSANGKRCDEPRFLEFDHVEPVARGGKATIENLRLRCRTHNQLEAERALGAGFMHRKRNELPHATRAQSDDRTRDVLAGLRHLGCRPMDARRAAEYVATIPCATLEESLRTALKFIGGKWTQNRAAPAG